MDCRALTEGVGFFSARQNEARREKRAAVNHSSLLLVGYTACTGDLWKAGVPCIRTAPAYRTVRREWCMVRPAGVEPATLWTGTIRSIQLSYGRISSCHPESRSSGAKDLAGVT